MNHSMRPRRLRLMRVRERERNSNLSLHIRDMQITHTTDLSSASTSRTNRAKRLLAAFRVTMALLLAGFASSALLTNAAHAQTYQIVSGYLPAGKAKAFFPRTPNNSVTDTIYQIAGSYNVSGLLTIYSGAGVEFLTG